MKGDKDALKKAQVIIDVLRKGAEQRQQSVDGLVHFVHDSVPEQQQQTKQQTKRQKTQQTQVTEAFSRVESKRNSASAPDEESKGAAELMCPHCREMFLPAVLEQHKELGCPQDPAEQFMSEEVVSNSTSRGRHALLS